MTTTRDLDTVSAPRSVARQAAFIGQATAVEQARAVAEVQAAVVVAQQIPRDMGRAEAEMKDACSRMGLADRAFYAVPNRGNGPSVHLARELARIFGNAQYGVHELRRDDEAGISEIQAFAWDVEKNVRSTRTFIVPHARMVKPKGGGKAFRDPLSDLADIYLNNQNIGARAVRECIFTILPAWFSDAAQEACHETLRNGEGKPLPERIEEMIAGFAAIDVGVDQLEQKLGRQRSAWGPGDIAQMSITFKSIRRGEVTRDDEFPQRRVTAEEITTAGGAGGTSPPAPSGVAVLPPRSPLLRRGGRDGRRASLPGPVEALRADSAPALRRGPEPKMSPTMQTNIMAAFSTLGVKGQDRIEYARALSDREHLSAMGELTAEQGARVLEVLRTSADVDALDQAVSGS